MKPGAETPDPNQAARDLDREFPEEPPGLLPPRLATHSLVGSPIPQDPTDRLRVTPPEFPRVAAGDVARNFPDTDTARNVPDSARVPPDPARALLEHLPGVAPGPGTILCPRCRAESPAGVEFCERCGLSFLETRAIEGTNPSVTPGAAALIGQTINGKYRVLSVLGEGGFGMVFKVELLLFDRANIFALKLLHPSLSQDRNFRRRFLREAGLALTLIHENTIQIREFGQMDDGHLFFTMDYCEGEPLKAVIAREGFLSLPRALHVVRQILSVLRHAHARGILHRDLKPENIFLEQSPGRDFVKVGDFGLAKSFDPALETGTPRERALRVPPPGGEDITRGGIVGTPRYMSPEQALGKDDLDQRSDLYAVGVILYEMLYGHVPPERVVPSGTVSVQLKTPTSLPGHAVPRDVWGVVRKALEVRREDRFQNAEAFLKAIDSLPSYTPTYVGVAGRRSPARVWFGRVAALIATVGVVWLSGQVLVSLHGNGRGARGGHRPEAQGSPGIPTVGLNGVRKSPSQEARASSQVDVETKARAPESARLFPFPRDGVLAFLEFQVGDVLRYQTYREGQVHDRDLSYTVVDIPEPGVYTLKVTPGDRTETWIVDEAKNEFRQVFMLPDPETGGLTRPETRLWLKLPRTDAVIDGDYMEKDLRVQAVRVDLEPPARHPKGDALTRCLRVESREEDRIHYHYYKEGKGLVAVEVYEMRLPPPAPPQAQGSREGNAAPPRSASQNGALQERPGGTNLPVLVYARYLVDVPPE